MLPGQAELAEANRCANCQGYGAVFVQVGRDSRVQAQCPDCGGTGHHSDALARVLTGEAKADTSNARIALEKYKGKLASFGACNAD